MSESLRPADAARSIPANPPAYGAISIAEPVVHRVAFDHPAQAGSADILDRIRESSLEKAPEPARPGFAGPESSSGGRGSGGFTGLLRALGTESTPPSAPPTSESGFTSLLQRLAPTTGSPSDATPAPTQEAQFAPPVAKPFSEATASGPIAPAANSEPGGITKLFQSASMAAPSTTPGPNFVSPASVSPAPTSKPAESAPGGFTQLFGSLGGAAAKFEPPAPTAGPTEGGTLTQLFSKQPQAPAAPPSYTGRESAGAQWDYGLMPGTATTPSSGGVSQQSFSAPPPPQPLPPQAPLQTSGVGVTKLFQMLDETSKSPAPRVEPPPIPSMPEQGAWTKAYSGLSAAAESSASAAATPPNFTPSANWPQATPVYSQPPAGEPASNPGGAGPSEFTRIMSASRLRENAMRGGQPAASGAPPTPAPQGGQSVPSFQPLATPAMPAPPQVPGYPMSIAPQGGAMPPSPQPAVFTPPPVPPMPTPPPIAAPPPAVGKLQQLVPLLLVIVIVLLAALLVTVILLLKH